MHLARAQRLLERFAIGVRDHQHPSAHRVLRHDDNHATLTVESQRINIEFPHYDLAPRSFRASSASAAFVAIASPPNGVALPFQSVKTPPASVMIGMSAAASHALTTSST